jgi:uncharacterized membrane protein
VASTDERLAALEQDLEALKRRVHRLEGKPAPAPSPPPVLAGVAARPAARPKAADLVEWPAPQPLRPEPAAQPGCTRSVDLEELLGGRVLALVGGIAVLLGLVFLVALAIERGWLDERARVALAFAGSVGLVAAGAWLYERRGRTQAALATAASGIAGLFLSLTAATSLYGLIPVPLALAGAFSAGAVGLVLALRWDSRTIAGLGVLGAIASPALLAATADLTALGFLAVALAASAAILTWRRWEWLRIAACVLATLQVAAWALADEPSVAVAVVVLALFGLLNVAAALGYEIRVPTADLRASTALLVGANALVIGGLGYAVIAGESGPRAAGVWMAGVAAAHLAAGVATLAARLAGRDVALLLLATSLTAGDIAFALLVDGPALAVGWALSALGLAVLTRVLRADGQLAHGTLAAQLTLAIAHTLMFDAPADALASGGTVSFAPLVAILVGAAGCARLAADPQGAWRFAADGLALGTLAYTTALALDGTALVVAWVAEALALLPIARRSDDRLAGIGVAGFLALTIGHVFAFEAPPDSLAYGVESVPAAGLSLAAVAAAVAAAARSGLGLEPREQRVLWLLAGALATYLVSVAIVDVFQPGGQVVDDGSGLGIRQQGQALLSTFWSLLGIVLLWVGLRKDERAVRLAGFGLLTIAVAKVFFVDMATLDSGYRVLSFIVLGLLLLAGAYAYQRMRRRPGGPATA